MNLSFDLSRLRNAEMTEYIQLLLDQSDPGDAPVPASFTNARRLLATHNADLRAILASDRFSALTDIIMEGDSERDDQLADLFAIVRACVRHPEDAAIRAAATTVQHKLANHGTAAEIGKDNFIAETATVDALLSDLRGPLAPQVSLLPIAPWVTGLDRSNAKVRNAYLERGEDEAGSLPFDAKQKRRLIQKAQGTLLRKSELFHEEHEGAAPWGVIKARVETLIEDFRHRLARKEGVAAANATPAAQG
ncbi:MAG: hypothetical protein EOO11_05660 [Chitinophagaceae bacterium]|nr:MAG: hypothetical protein EOO11_05660 [Chitinophagaceae bacterium]